MMYDFIDNKAVLSRNTLYLFMFYSFTLNPPLITKILGFSLLIAHLKKPKPLTLHSSLFGSSLLIIKDRRSDPYHIRTALDSQFVVAAHTHRTDGRTVVL